jgi:hypothetical protein
MTRHVLLLNSDKTEVMTALARRDDLRLRVITRKKYADLYAGQDVAFVDGFHHLDQVGQAATELARTGPLDYIVAPTEKSVPAGGLVRGLLGLPGPSYDQCLWTTHKRAMKDRLRAAGLPVTDYAQAASVDGIPAAVPAVGWPVVVKPVFGAGSAATHRLASADDFAERQRAGDLDDLAGTNLPVQVERLVDVISEYHCDAVVRDGEVRAAGVLRYFDVPLDSWGGVLGSHFIDPAGRIARWITELNTQVVRALGLRDAVTHLEVFETPTGLVIGEVALRVGGCGVPRVWQRAHGVDLWDEFVRASLGEPSDAAVLPVDRVHAWVQVSHAPGRLRLLSALPWVVEVRPAGDVIDVQFTAADEAAAVAGYRRLGELTEQP